MAVPRCAWGRSRRTPVPTPHSEGQPPRLATPAVGLFSFISQNWRATPLVSDRVIVDLIGATTTRTGLSVRCELDPNRYPKGVTVSDAEMAGLNIARDEFHGEWNYTLSPRSPDQALVP